jgi:hypothetical protein
MKRLPNRTRNNIHFCKTDMEDTLQHQSTPITPTAINVSTISITKQYAAIYEAPIPITKYISCFSKQLQIKFPDDELSVWCQKIYIKQ